MKGKFYECRCQTGGALRGSVADDVPLCGRGRGLARLLEPLDSLVRSAQEPFIALFVPVGYNLPDLLGGFGEVE